MDKTCLHPDEDLEFLSGYPIGKSAYLCKCGVIVHKPWDYDVKTGQKWKPERSVMREIK